MAGIMVGQLYAKLSLEGAASVAQGLNRIKSNVINLKSAFAALTGGIGLTMVAKDLINTGAKFEAYRKRILAVADSAEEANAVFERISEWAGMNPVDTDDAIAAFVRLRTAAVDNAEEATKQLGNLAAVMGTTMEDAANTLVSLNTVALRSAGVMLDQTGKKARIQIGETVIYAEKKASAIREAIIKAIKIAYAGQIDTMKDTWQGNINTMSGMWIDFKRKLMGDAGTGGPFDAIKSVVQKIREEWEKWIQTESYKKFLQQAQEGVKALMVKALSGIQSVTRGMITLFSWLEKYGSAFKYGLLGKVLFGAKGAAVLAALGLASDIDENDAKMAKHAAANPLNSKVQEELEIQKILIESMKSFGGSFNGKEWERGWSFYNNEERQRNFDVAKTKYLESRKREQETRDRIRADAKASLTEGTNWLNDFDKEVTAAFSDLKKEISKPFQKSPGDAGKKSAAVRGGVGDFIDEAEQLKTAQERIKRIGAEIKYANKNYQDFTAEIDRQVKAMPEYSDAWLAWKALQTEAHEQITSKIEEDNRRIQSSEQQKYSLGLSRAQDYFQKLIGFYKDYKGKAKAATLEKERNQYSDSASGVMSEIYSVANDAVSRIQTRLDDGDMTAKAADEAVKSLIKAFEELGWKAPEALEKLRKSLDPVELFNEQLKTNVKEWTQSLKDGITDAIVECKSLSDVLTSIGNQIQKFALNWILWGGGTGKGLLGGLFGSLGALGARHSGGVVGADSPSFTRRFKMPKYHTGGIVGVDEEMAILKKGEGVFTKAQMEAIGSASPTMNTSVTVNVNNNGGGDMTDEQAQLLGKTVKMAVQAQVAEELYKYQRQGYFRQRAGAF